MFMSQILSDRFRRWFDYECDAHARVFASLETVPPDRHDSAEYQKAVSLIAHIVLARQRWLGRLGQMALVPGSLFPTDMSAAEVAALWTKVAAEWSTFLGSLDDAALAQVVEYQSLEAGGFQNRLEEILTHVFGHSFYHRGQIATLVKAAGGEPAVTDFIYWSREPVTV